MDVSDRLGSIWLGFEATVLSFAPSSQSTKGTMTSHTPFLWRSPDSLRSPVNSDFSQGFCSGRGGGGTVCHDRHGNTLPGGSWAALPGRGSCLESVPPRVGIRRQGHQQTEGLKQQGLGGGPSQQAGRQVGKASRPATREWVSLTQGLARATHVGRSHCPCAVFTP